MREVQRSVKELRLNDRNRVDAASDFRRLIPREGIAAAPRRGRRALPLCEFDLRPADPGPDLAFAFPAAAPICDTPVMKAWHWALVGGVGLAAVGGVVWWARHRERLPGGVAAGKRPSDFDPRQLRAGTEVELEHTPNRAIATEIAMDHLTEDPRYYSKLCRMWPNERGCALLR